MISLHADLYRFTFLTFLLGAIANPNKRVATNYGSHPLTCSSDCYLRYYLAASIHSSGMRVK